MITIKEMADMLGVSPTTVSNVIHGKTREVSKGTIEKIEKVIKECNYIPNMSARTLAQNSSRIIGVVMKYPQMEGKNAVQDPFNSELLGALEAKIREAGYYMMLYASHEVDEILNLTVTWNVDGLILLGVHASDCQRIKKRTSKPVVFIDCYFHDDGIEYVNVGLEDRESACAITQYLISQGHRKIAFLADNCIGVDAERWKGYVDAMEANHISVLKKNFILLQYGEQGMKKSLQEIYKRRSEFTALLFASDYYAVRGMHYLLEHGVQIPEDISVVGFDDNILGRNMWPGLTTVRQNPTKKGILAVRQLLCLIQKKELKEKNIRLKTELIFRDTVKKIY